LYAQTHCVEAAAAVRLRHLWEGRVPMPPEGGSQRIAIRYAAGHPRGICHQSERQYRWSEPDDLPKLPGHWGCRWMYVLWERQPGLTRAADHDHPCTTTATASRARACSRLD
jgi:hypothetical protein